jgi:hypothetical protein
LFHQVRLEKQGGFAGPIGFPSDTTTSHGPWPGTWTEAGRGAATVTPNPSRIGQTSRTPVGKYLLYSDQNTFFGFDQDYNRTIVFSIDIKRDYGHPYNTTHQSIQRKRLTPTRRKGYYSITVEGPN